MTNSVFWSIIANEPDYILYIHVHVVCVRYVHVHAGAMEKKKPWHSNVFELLTCPLYDTCCM